MLWNRDLWWLIVVTLTLQGVVPLAACLWLAYGAAHRTLVISRLLLIGAYLLCITLAGVWLWLPWWSPLVWLALFVIAAGSGWWRTEKRAVGAALPGGIGGPAIGVATILLLLLAGYAWSGRQPPGRGRAEFEFPLAAGHYLVFDGGRNGLVNSEVPSWRPDRGDDSRSIAVVRIDGEGLRARALLPARLERYLSYDDVVYAPCSGRVIELENDQIDQAPGVLERANAAGNFLQIRCGEQDVRLHHLRQGSISVRRGAAVLAKDPVARVGNSGRAGEPHLRFYAWTNSIEQTSQRSRALTMTFKGQVLTRNDRVHQVRVEPEPPGD